MPVVKTASVWYTDDNSNKGCLDMKKRWLSFLLSAAMLVAMLPTALAASDIESHWAKSYIEYLDREGVINPSATTGNYEPDRDMTRAEFMRYINRAFHFTEKTSISYTDVPSNAWYYETIQIAERYGYINGTGNNKMEPEGKVTREQAAVIIGRLFKADPGNVSPSDLTFTDKSQVSDWAAGYIKAAADKGFIAGYSDGTFKPGKVVSRGEVAKILYYYLGTSLSTAGKAYTGADLKTDTTNVTISENCTLSDAAIQGDLYITEGLGSDAVTLTNVTVNGSIIVSGGTVTMVNTTSDHMIVSSPMGRLMQVTATGATHIKQTEVQTAATLYEKGLTTTGYEGYADVVVNGGERVSLTLDANVTNLTLEDEATVSTTAGAAVYHLTADKAASITGYGSVYQADINADGVSFASSVTVSGYTLGRGGDSHDRRAVGQRFKHGGRGAGKHQRRSERPVRAGQRGKYFAAFRKIGILRDMRRRDPVPVGRLQHERLGDPAADLLSRHADAGQPYSGAYAFGRQAVEHRGHGNQFLGHRGRGRAGIRPVL